MGKHWRERLLSRLESAFAWLGYTFVNRWGAFERGYRRPYARVALRLRFAFYPLLVLVALGWLAWDWNHGRGLASAENAIFDQVIKLRPWEPKPSGKVVVVEIDDCSIEYYRARGEGGWPWSRQRHADLLDALDRAGVRAVGYDVQFIEPSNSDPLGDATLEAMAAGGNGRFLFGSTRMPPGFDDSPGAIPVSRAPGAFALAAHPQRPGPRVALLLPYGEAMARNSGLLDIARDADGVLRDIPLRKAIGDWALPSLSLRLAAAVDHRPPSAYPASIRVNWRTHDRLPYASAADLIEGRGICDRSGAMPGLQGRTVLVGYTAAGLNDAKPTPANPTMPGVEVHAEAVEALLAGTAIWMPPAGFKYLFAAFLVVFSCFVFWRGEPSWDMDAVFFASNLALLGAAFVGLSLYGVFFDIFAALAFVSLVFGLCRSYAATLRGRAVGNDDYRPQFDPARDRWLAMVRLRFVPHDDDIDRRETKRRVREYRRRLRGWLYRGPRAVAIEGIVEYKHFLYESLMDITVLMWGGPDRETVAATARRELQALCDHLAGHDDVLSDDGSVRVASLVSVAAAQDEPIAQTRARVCSVLGQLLASTDERALSARHAFFPGDVPDEPAGVAPAPLPPG
jgi:CHASE2 domain-containing sensor protein